MDGKKVEVIVIVNVGWPNGITIDFLENKIYWIDAKYHYINCVNYDGTQRQTIIQGKQYISHPFAMTMSGDYLYFTDWLKKSIIRVSKTKKTADYRVLLSNLSKPMDLKLISPERQPYAPNPCDNSGNKKSHKCQHLCVIKSYNDSACLCRPRYQLMSDGYSCSEVRRFLIFARSWEVRGISLDVAYTKDVMIPILGLHAAVGLDFHASEEYIYFSDVKEFKIGRFNIGNDFNASVDWIIEDGLEKTSGIAVDWMGGNIFWTDVKVNKQSVISVAKLDGSFRKVIINKSLDEPRAIVVHPNAG